MPAIRFVETYPVAVQAVLDYFRRPANVVAVAPPGVDLMLIEGPEVVFPGSVFAVQLRRVGMSQRIDTEVVVVEEHARIVERQLRGPFARWVIERRFAEMEDGTELAETIDFAPPGGLLGLMITPKLIEDELRKAYAGRRDRVLLQINAT